MKAFLRIHFTGGEWALWLISLAVVTAAFLLSGSADGLSIAASLVGVTALIFVAKGHPLGQLLTIVFAVLYGIISLRVRYYGEMITYLGMTAPMALLALITWLRNPYQESAEVAVRRMRRIDVAVMLLLTLAATVLFYFILRAMGNAALAVSTLSVTTSFLASYLTAMRSPYYALCCHERPGADRPVGHLRPGRSRRLGDGRLLCDVLPQRHVWLCQLAADGEAAAALTGKSSTQKPGARLLRAHCLYLRKALMIALA